jgi:hypothetical protein
MLLAGVVDQHVDLAPALDDLADQALACRGVPKIAGKGQRLGAFGLAELLSIGRVVVLVEVSPPVTIATLPSSRPDPG